MNDDERLENTILRSTPCPECGADMVWTQSAWHAGSGGEARAAYCCLQGHVLDPSTTRQCPACGVHDTTLLGNAGGRQDFRCARCGESFTFPRS
jgi:putative hemolysin